MKSIYNQHLITLDEPTHEYKVKGINHLTFTSVTTFIHDFFSPFDSKGMAEKLAGTGKYANKTPQDLLNDWEQSGVHGTKVHNELEDYLNAWRDDKEKPVLTEPKSQHGEQWIKKMLEPSHVPYPEIKVYSEHYQLAGTVDLLVHDEDSGKWVICDWKTNKAIRTSGYRGAKGTKYATRMLDDCNYNHYALQMSLYQYLLEKEYGIKIHNRFLLHLLPKPTANYPLGVRTYAMEYLKPNVEKMLEYRIELKREGKLFENTLH